MILAQITKLKHFSRHNHINDIINFIFFVIVGKTTPLLQLERFHQFKVIRV